MVAGSVGGVFGGAEVVLIVSDEPFRLSVDALLLVLATLSVFLCSDTRLCVRETTLGFAFGRGGTGIFASFFTGVPEILLLAVEAVDVVERMDGAIDGAFLTTGLLVEGDFEAKLVVDFVVLTEEVLILDAVELFRERAVLYAVLAPSFVVFVLTVETRELGRDDTIDNGGRKLEAGDDFLTVEAWLRAVRTDAMDDAVDFGLDNVEDVDVTDRRDETEEGPTIFLGKGALGVVRASVSSTGSLSEGVGAGEDDFDGVSFESGRGSVTLRRGDEAEAVEVEATENLDAAVRTLRTEGVMDAFDRAGRLRERTLTRMDCMSLSLSLSFGALREARGVFFAPPFSAGFRISSTGISILSLISLTAHPSMLSNPPSFLTPSQRLRNQDKTSSLVCST